MARKHKRKKQQSNKSNPGQNSAQKRPSKPENAAFSLMVKLMYKFIQTIHHLAFLISLPDGQYPPALCRLKDQMDRFWKPSSNNELVQEKLRALSKTYMDGAIAIIKDHYKTTSNDLASKLKLNTMNHDDFSKAKNIASSWAKKNYRKKLSDNTLADFNDKCEEITNQTQSKSQKPQEPTTLASNSDQPSNVHTAEKTVKSNTSQANDPLASNVTETPKRKRQPTPPNSPTSPVSSDLKAASPSVNAPPTKQVRTSVSQARARTPPRAPNRSFKPYRAEGLKTRWTMPQIRHSLVVIGDSNLDNITKSPSSLMHILSYPGAIFYNIKSMLSRANPCKGVKDVVISLGINERNNQIQQTSIPMLRKLITEMKRVFPNARIHMAKLQWNSAKLSPAQIKALTELNDCMPALSDVNILPSLQSNLFQIDPNDRQHGIHWTKECANKMLDNWFCHLN